jgi:acyl carrier protein phosphodiesterase
MVSPRRPRWRAKNCYGQILLEESWSTRNPRWRKLFQKVAAATRTWSIRQSSCPEILLNWLAHVLLSESTIEFRLGNLLADLVRGDARAVMPIEFVRGAARHKAIDAFTDAHPIVHASRARVAARHRRFSGVLIDIFYDYCLARRWGDFVAEPLPSFTARFYAEAAAHPLDLPPAARATLERIVQHDLLGQYARIEGVENSLRRVSGYIAKRWQRDYQLEAAAQDLLLQEAEFAGDFAEFFPQLQQHVAKLSHNAH